MQTNKSTLLRILLLVPCALFLLTSCGPPPPDNRTPAPDTGNRTVPTPIPVLTSDVRDTAYFLNRYVDLSWLASTEINEKPIMRSSQHPNSGIADFRTVQGEETIDGEPWKILFDEEGPGCISRIWMGANVTGDIRFYFDNEETPRIDMPLIEFFQGNTEAFPHLFLYTNPDIAASFMVTTGSFVSYIPMPYSERLKIAIRSEVNDVFYQINALELGEGNDVVSFSPEFDQRTQTAFQAANDVVQQVRYNQILEEDKRKSIQTIAPGEKVRFANLTGPAAIEFFDIRFDDFSRSYLDDIRIELHWDQLPVPGVNCTLRQFLGNIDDSRELWNSLFMGVDFSEGKNLIFSNFYMPFRKSAQVFFENTSDEPIRMSFSYLLDLVNVPNRPMYFLSSSVERQQMYIGVNYPRFNFEGGGRLVGTAISIDSDPLEPIPFVLEGDENVYLEGEAKSSMGGTGLDHQFNWVHQWVQGPWFLTSLYGCFEQKVENDRVIMSSYRWNVMDSIPFEKSLLIVQELGDPDQFFQQGRMVNEQANMKMTHFWYADGTTPVDHQRQEEVFFFTITDSPEGAPNLAHPVFRGVNLNMHLIEGDWYVHLAPIWNINQVQTIHNTVSEDDVLPDQPE